ncbi:SDR family NAD(P)-dependent oxidoreductase [Actinosynnema mirum]|uniref:Oxidoreductase, short chain dehydrogenase/reductase family n=1 Tax=Actinosynnema mirum (strain ATCC 29888 / DSM 43827 / JCM 3225 / NBRC 14064 / NCIMB 13271 / NRRL B-12336 / IMRU 3971 / 101) TaxID=446462 RepID=C6WIL6_ACTMD|nr:SDR family NAD(P)-dependent oxidoreductase [Actinosynnema mirum]ACU38106.1 oxidoreductase, short chain dehydrogenase/reductase family [Actinosynnema mirum DSM 43827]
MHDEFDEAAFHAALARLRALPEDDPARLRAERAAESLVRDGKQRRRRARGARHAAADARTSATTATGAADRREDAPLPAVPDAEPRPLHRSRRCYVCKRPYRLADAFYHLLCPDCAADNTRRRTASTDLTGRRALLTGGRVKIGFQLALMLLRDGADLVVTTRFPRDAARRFAQAEGSADWLHRLTVVGVDLRDPRQVLGLCQELRSDGAPLDILINNAAQTVRRPPEAYAPLTAAETGPLPPGVRLAPGYRAALPADRGRAALELVLADRATPVRLDEAGLVPDTAPANSWSARLGELDPAEVLETQLVNAFAPALLCDRLLPLLLASPAPRRYVVNVTAVEGRFEVRNKTSGHPHTNMAKAALNMLTRTSGPDLARQGVHMCAVDTGWVTDENPAPKKEHLARQGFRTPLDVVDGAARVYDPIVRGEAGDPVSGVFLKDYREAAW